MFYDEGSEALAQVTQKGGGCPILGDIQDQTGQGSDVAVGVLVHCRGVEAFLPNQMLL